MLLVLFVLLILALGTVVALVDGTRHVATRLRTDRRDRGLPRHARFDWNAGTVTLQVGDRRRAIELSAIEGVVHRCRPMLTDSWSELELLLPGQDELLLVTDIGPAPGTADVFRLTVGLARALAVPWRFDGLDLTRADPLGVLRS